jgi:hypothetical protein
MEVQQVENYLAKGVLVHSHIQWIQEGDKGSIFYFDFLKQKVAVESVLGLRRTNGSFVEDPI